MEQCRKAGKSHWYHETQSTMSSQTPLSLMPEAALTPFESWLKPARQLADVFPARFSTTGFIRLAPMNV